MKSSKTKITNKKFYNKWTYKVSLLVKGVGVFRNVALTDISEHCNRIKINSRGYSSDVKVLSNQEMLTDLANCLLTFDNAVWSKRIERDSIDLYTNDSNFYQTLSDKFEEVLIHRFEPQEGSNLLEQSQQVIVGKKLPHDRYRYRVYLLPHKMSGDREGKRRYLDWVKNQGDKIRLSKAVDEWFIRTDWNWDRRYVLVEDDQTLLMLKLRNAEVVGRIYNFVVSDK
jgi:hypothetical protein